MEIKYITNGEITSEEIIDVFQSVGWNKEPELVVDAFKNSFYVTAYEGDKMVGFARAISDRHFYTGIYDVVVRQEYQGRGIAKQMMHMLLKEFDGTYFFLTYTEGNGPFYEKCGFEQVDNSMWIPRWAKISELIGE